MAINEAVARRFQAGNEIGYASSSTRNMRCLNNDEQKSWLSRHSIPESTYEGGGTQEFYIQFHTPEKFRQLQFFLNGYFYHFLGDSSALVAITDWWSYQPFEMNLVEKLRLIHGEKRPLIEASGHLFEAKEKDDIIALFSLATAFGWKSYLYLPNQKTTLYNWEGDMMDFWTESDECHKAMAELIH